MEELTGWTHDVPPFHAGEQALQERVGLRERLDEIGRHVMRTRMPQQHRDFFAQLDFVALGAVDAQGQPWATLLPGTPGFVHASAPSELRVDTLPAPSDPVSALLREGARLALLGIELSTRRRNRANGVIARVDETGFLFEVQQSFGNCPKYIQQRRRGPLATPMGIAGTPRRSHAIPAASAQRLRRADTFFIATSAGREDINAGSDVSHRGGLPGFVDVSEDGLHLAWPEFLGNNFFNTLGNIALQPRTGLVFPDFETGSLLHVAGRASIVWDGPEVQRITRAQRLVRLEVDEVIEREGALPWRYSLMDMSPALAGTGVWERR